MKKTLILLSIFLISLSGIGQSEYLFNDMRNIRGQGSDLTDANRKRTLTHEEIKNILGSQYENEQFLPSTITQNGKLILNDIKLRYNALSDLIEVKDEQSVLNEAKMTLWTDPDAVVKILNDSYRYISPGNSVGNGGYFKILSDGENGKFYKKTTIKHLRGEKATNPYEKDKLDRFEREDVYYIVQNGEFTELSDRKSKILSTLGDKKSEIKKYLKDNKLDFKNEKDLTTLVNYYFSLKN